MEKLKTKLSRLFTRHNLDLFAEMVRVQFSIYGHNSIFGVFWSLLAPLTTLLILYLVFRMRFGFEITAYPLFILIGIVCVDLFINATNYLMKVFYTNKEIALSVAMPRELIIASDLFIHVYKFIIELILCAGLAFFYHLFSWQRMLFLGPLVFAYIMFVLGIGFVIALVYCFIRDTEYIWHIISHILYFVTPVFYAVNSVTPLMQKLLYFGNPLTPFLISFRGIFMGVWDTNSYIHSLFLGVGFFILGYLFFVIFENQAVEKI